MENIYHHLLGIPQAIKHPDYYELLGIEESLKENQKIEESYREQIQKLQKFGNNPKYKDTILFLKGELRKACNVLSNSTLRIEYDLVLSEEKVEALEREIHLLKIKGELYPKEIEYLQNRAIQLRISPIRLQKILRSKGKIEFPIKKEAEEEEIFLTSNKEQFVFFFLLVSIAVLTIAVFFYFTKSKNLEKQLQILEARQSKPKQETPQKESIQQEVVSLPKEQPQPSLNISDMIYIPAGEFLLGCDKGNEDEQPVRKIYLDAYYIRKYEVTNQEYQEFVKETIHPIPYLPRKEAEPFNWDPLNKTAPEGRLNYPVTLVTWYDAMEYCKWLSRRTKKNVTLPTEAQWEKAAKGEKNFLYPWGNEKNSNQRYFANFATGSNKDNDGFTELAPIGSFPQGSSPYGCMDMAGNAFEWCMDSYDKFAYQEIPSRNPLILKEESLWPWKSLRGGSWHDSEIYLRTSYRFASRGDQNDIRYGFRYVIVP